MRKINIALALTAAVLAVLCWLSVSEPMRFDKERERREAVVKQRLVSIRAAAERFRQRSGAYTGSLQTLVDSAGLADSLRYIPFAAGKRTFHLQASSVVSRAGRSTPVMECYATYDEYLDGLDRDEIMSLTSAAGAAGRFAGLKIGDLGTPNDNSGNWE